MREADAREFLARIGATVAIVSLLAFATGMFWEPLGFSQPRFTEEQETKFEQATLEYHRLAHGRALPEDPREREEFLAKVTPVKAAYEQQVAAIESVTHWNEWKRKLLLFGGALGAICGAFFAKTMETGR